MPAPDVFVNSTVKRMGDCSLSSPAPPSTVIAASAWVERATFVVTVERRGRDSPSIVVVEKVRA
jgi:hypothetical protein